ncbi:MAG: hypothetical protein K2X29_00965 [Candidatus Obscuribacterales bacterium]|nr:hypothetical protein [Candidatus Obscuribacterales bacterium]
MLPLKKLLDLGMPDDPNTHRLATMFERHFPLLWPRFDQMSEESALGITRFYQQLSREENDETRIIELMHQKIEST